MTGKQFFLKNERGIYGCFDQHDKGRLRVISALLDDDELCVCQIIEMLGLATATVSRHMSILHIQEPGVDLKQVLAVLSDAVVVMGTDFTIQFVNAVFTRLSGWKYSEAIGKKCYDIFPGELCRTKDCPMNRIKEGVERIRYETDKHCVCGRKSPGIITANAYRSPGGILSGMIEIVSDMAPLYESRERFRKAMGGVIQAMSLTIEKRDPYTAVHQRRVTKMTRLIAQEMGFSWERTQGLRMASAIHDLGKILVPAVILNKSGEISETEMAIIRAHPQTAYDILKGIDFPWPLAQTIYQHHERMDGSGYPQGLKGAPFCLRPASLQLQMW